MADRSRSQKIKTMILDKKNIDLAAERLSGVVTKTPLQQNFILSEELGCHVYMKREDLQVVRSYKLRGAYNKMVSLTDTEKKNGIVCASAGNHAQGVAFSCFKLNIEGIIFMPVTTPQQKVKQVKLFGKDKVKVILQGDTFDDSQKLAVEFCHTNKKTFVHPFDDEKVMEGQGTVAKEILEEVDFKIDYLFLPIGGGGLASGMISYFKAKSPETKIVGVEPMGAPSMKTSLENNRNTTLDSLDKFVDGASVKRVGDRAFEICKNHLYKMITVAEGKVCTTILDLYNQQAIVAEPAGALTIASLSLLQDELKGKNVVCVLSGGNNDISRTEEIRERSLMHEGLKHYFIIRFPQRSGALKQFVSEVLDSGDDIVHFEYIKKNNRENGPALIGLILPNFAGKERLCQRLSQLNFEFEYLNEKDQLLQLLI